MSEDAKLCPLLYTAFALGQLALVLDSRDACYTGLSSPVCQKTDCALWQVDQPARTLTTTDPLGEEEQLPETGFCGLVAAPMRYVYKPAGAVQITPFGGKPWLFGGQK